MNNNSMFDIKSTVRGDIVSIVANGEYSLLKAHHLFESSIDYALLHNRGKILIDVNNVTGNIPLMDRFYFSENLANYRKEHGLSNVHKIAVVGKEPIVHEEKFGELVAMNRGVNSRVFTDMKQASDWLSNE
jgi:hypothetical protein